MAIDKKISQLTNGAPAQAADEYVVARGGANYKLTLTNIAATMPPIGASTPNTGAFTTLTTSSTVTVNGGTANGVLYLNASKAATSGTALVFDGTNLGIGTTSPLGTLDVTKSNAGGVGGSLVIRNNATNTANNSAELVFKTSSGFTAGFNSAKIASIQPSVTEAADLAFYTYGSGTGTERARITSGGNLLVGTTTGPSRLQIVGGTINSGGGTGLGISSNLTSGYFANGPNVASIASSTDASTVEISAGSTGGQSGIAVSGSGGDVPSSIRFFANGSERARITSGGYFKASNNGTYRGSTGSYHELRSTQNDAAVAIVTSAATNGNQYGFQIETANDQNDATRYFLSCIGNLTPRAIIYTNGGLANYQANDTNLSDERVKTDIKPVGSYWNKIKGIEIVTFKYKDQTHNDDNVGVIAQQVESVAPEFVDVDGFGETPEDGVPLKTIYTTDMYHAAIKALQEAMARIEQLEAKVAALESK